MNADFVKAGEHLDTGRATLARPLLNTRNTESGGAKIIFRLVKKTRQSKEKPMTKHDFQKALDAAEGAFQGYGYMSQDAEVHMEALRYLVKLAAIVTGEPSEEMTIAGCEAWKNYPVAVVTQFKAMIAEAQRQAEGEE